MPDLLPNGPLLSAFLIASLLLAVTPGPGVLYIVARSLGEGRRAGLASVAGVALGNFGNALAAAFGLATLFAISALAFTIVKYAGAAYLVYLGVQMLRRPVAAPGDVPPASLPDVFRDGFVVALFNPKTTLFFAAFLPQFMDAEAEPLTQSLMLGALFVAIAAITDSLYALGAGALMPILKRFRDSPALARRLGGGLFIGLGIFAALTGQRK
ncbi:LysE family translocator [Sulfuricystis thermophila]|uniref:LysE family translocator n=1 Tax=Sulfuricystis thermophila TaxID=2496847 RepID=UPI001035B584|nr:LysE family translocator [Sulfuricystis thermophila]